MQCQRDPVLAAARGSLARYVDDGLTSGGNDDGDQQKASTDQRRRLDVERRERDICVGLVTPTHGRALAFGIHGAQVMCVRLAPSLPNGGIMQTATPVKTLPYVAGPHGDTPKQHKWQWLYARRLDRGGFAAVAMKRKKRFTKQPRSDQSFELARRLHDALKHFPDVSKCLILDHMRIQCDSLVNIMQFRSGPGQCPVELHACVSRHLCYAVELGVPFRLARAYITPTGDQYDLHFTADDFFVELAQLQAIGRDVARTWTVAHECSVRPAPPGVQPSDYGKRITELRRQGLND